MKKCLLLCLLIAVVQLHGGPAVSKAVRAAYERRGYVIAAAVGAAAMQLWQQRSEQTPENKASSKHKRVSAIGGAEDLLQDTVPEELTQVITAPLAEVTITQHILAGLCTSLSPMPLAEEHMQSMPLSALATYLEQLLIDEFGQLSNSLKNRDTTIKALIEAVNGIRVDPGISGDPVVQQTLRRLGTRLQQIADEQVEETCSSSLLQRSVNSLVGDLRFALTVKKQ